MKITVGKLLDLPFEIFSCLPATITTTVDSSLILSMDLLQLCQWLIVPILSFHVTFDHRVSQPISGPVALTIIPKMRELVTEIVGFWCDIIMLRLLTGRGNVAVVGGNISSSLMSNYGKTDQLGLLWPLVNTSVACLPCGPVVLWQSGPSRCRGLFRGVAMVSLMP